MGTENENPITIIYDMFRFFSCDLFDLCVTRNGQGFKWIVEWDMGYDCGWNK